MSSIILNFLKKYLRFAAPVLTFKYEQIACQTAVVGGEKKEKKSYLFGYL